MSITESDTAFGFVVGTVTQIGENSATVEVLYPPSQVRRWQYANVNLDQCAYVAA